MFIFRRSSWTVIVGVVLFYSNESVADDCVDTCPFGWVYEEGSCYVMVYQKLTWMEASVLCRAQGAKLAEINDKKEDEVLSHWAKADVKTWLGGTDLLRENKWVWMSTGEEMVYKNWKVKSDNNHEKEHCLAYWKHLDTWDGSDCFESAAFICEKMTKCSKSRF